MKKTFFVSVFCLISAISWSGKRTIVVRGTSISQTGNTEVKNLSDSLVVKPTINISMIAVRVSNMTGTVISEQFAPAHTNSIINVTIPSLPNGCMLEIHDDNGLVYSEQED